MNGLESGRLRCPYCGEVIEVFIDPSIAFQQYTEDCPVCCQPMVLTVTVDDGEIAIAAQRENE